MITKIKDAILALATLSAIATPALVLAPAVHADVTPAQIQSSLCTGSNFNVNGATGSGCSSTASTDSFNTLLAKVITIFSAIVGVIAVVMIIVGGLRYITSGGDTSKVSSAKTTILYAIIGLVIVALAQIIVHFVLNQATGIAG